MGVWLGKDAAVAAAAAAALFLVCEKVLRVERFRDTRDELLFEGEGRGGSR